MSRSGRRQAARRAGPTCAPATLLRRLRLRRRDDRNASPSEAAEAWPWVGFESERERARGPAGPSRILDAQHHESSFIAPRLASLSCLASH